MPKTRYTTKEDVREIVQEATDAILTGMEEMFKNVPTRNEFNELKNDVTEIKSDIHFIKDDIKNLEVQISTLPTRLEFEKLKSQVNKSYV